MKYLERIKSILLKRQGIVYLENTDSLSLPKIVTEDSLYEALSYHKFRMLKENNGYYTFIYNGDTEGNLMKDEVIYAISFKKLDLVKLELGLLLKELGIHSDSIVRVDKYISSLSEYSLVGKIDDEWFCLEEKTVKDKYTYRRCYILEVGRNKYTYAIEKDKIFLWKHNLNNGIETSISISFNDITVELSDGKRRMRLNTYIDRNDLTNDMLLSLSNILLRSLYGKIFDAYYEVTDLFKSHDIVHDGIRLMQINDHNKIIQSIDIVSDNMIFTYVYVCIDGISYRCEFNEEGYVKSYAVNNDGFKEDIDYLDSKCIKLTKELKQRRK